MYGGMAIIANCVRHEHRTAFEQNAIESLRIIERIYLLIQNFLTI